MGRMHRDTSRAFELIPTKTAIATIKNILSRMYLDFQYRYKGYISQPQSLKVLCEYSPVG